MTLKIWNDYTIRSTRPADVPGIVALSRVIYRSNPYTAAELQSQIDTFPQGQFVAVGDDGTVLGMSSSILLNDGALSRPADWATVTGAGTLSTHVSTGNVLYGVETMVDLDWRHRGVGTELIVARLKLARVAAIPLVRTGARLAGYGAVSSVLAPSDYVRLVLARRMSDPGLCFFLKLGFKAKDVVENYLTDDPESAGCAVIMDYAV